MPREGGLADVVDSLTVELAKAGHDVRAVVPKYAGMNNFTMTRLENTLVRPVLRKDFNRGEFL